MTSCRLGWLLLIVGVASANAQPAPALDYARDVAPILNARCAECHGPKQAKSSLRVDDRSNLLRGGDSGEPSVVPGDPERSRLIQAIRGDHPDLRMPPKGKLLDPAQQTILRRWVELGAAMPEPAAKPAKDHWAFQPVRPVTPPALVDPRLRNPIDAFIAARLREKTLMFSEETDPRSLIRRLQLVVLGLPPSVEEVENWVSDRSSLAYERLVDSALGRPQFGERWAQHWLDVIRWAQTWGYETNLERPDSWPYRDWLIRALNADRSFDAFITAQLAGDTLADDAATALLVAGPANLPGQIGKDEPSMRQARQDELDETIKTVSAAFLGLTLGCARCHDHKFDPLTQRDYYAAQAVFSGLHYGARRLRGPLDAQWSVQAKAARAERTRRLEELEQLRSSRQLRPPLTPENQTDPFAPIDARAIRMNIRATSDGGRASVFELQAWTAEQGGTSRNVALATAGGRASASSFALENQTRHPDNLIDGLLSKDDRFPWTARDPGPAWMEVELAAPARLDRVVWQQGYGGFPADYTIEVRRPDGSWVEVARSDDRLPHRLDRRPAAQVRLRGLDARQVAEVVSRVAALRTIDAEVARLEAGPQVFAGTFGTPEPSYRLFRGDPMQRKEVVPPGVPTVFGSTAFHGTDDPARRLAFARWVASPENPLTARVLVNRLWQHVFGTGLVETPSDFGRMGATPSHPELLDWLAGELVRSGWSIKHVLRLLVTSHTFRQASAPRAEALAVDADSRLLWRFPPRRLEAEAIRDAIVRASGAYNSQMEGPGFDLFHQKGGLTDYIPRESEDPGSWRRMVYATKVRMKPVDVFGNFDCPDAGQLAPRRARSTTPVQALGLFNSQFVNRQAEILAAHVERVAGPDRRAQVRRAFERALGRPPRDDEMAALVPLAEAHGLAAVGRVLFNANEFVFIP